MPINDNDISVEEFFSLARIGGDDDTVLEDAIRGQLRKASQMLMAYVVKRAMKHAMADPERFIDDPEAMMPKQSELASDAVKKYKRWLIEELSMAGFATAKK